MHLTCAFIFTALLAVQADSNKESIEQSDEYNYSNHVSLEGEDSFYNYPSQINSRKQAVVPLTFTCPSKGIFPDPSSCDSYYRCTETLQATLYNCPAGTYFNSNSLKCDTTQPNSCLFSTTVSTTDFETTFDLSSTTASSTTTNSSTSTDSSTITDSSTSMDSSTITDSSTSTEFSTTTDSSTSTDTSTTTDSPTTTDSSTDSTTESIASTEILTTESSPATDSTTHGEFATTSPLPFECTTAGIFPDSTNCHSYFRCSETLKATQYNCPGTTYFDPSTKKCTTNAPAGCGATSAPTTTSTTTKKPTTTSTTTKKPTTTSTTTKKPTTTSTTTRKPTTPSTTTTKPFTCEKSGVFSDPGSCRTYYRCTAGLVKYQYTCPGTTYFNPSTLQCGPTKPATCP